jgi:hypothetical protein
MSLIKANINDNVNNIEEELLLEEQITPYSSNKNPALVKNTLDNAYYIKLRTGIIMVPILKSNDVDFLYNKKFSLASKNSYFFELAIAKHFNKNFALEFNSSYNSITYKMTDTSLSNDIKSKYNGNYVEITDLSFVVDVYYNYYFNKTLFNLTIPNFLHSFNPFVALGVGMGILTPTYGVKINDDNSKRLNNTYFTGIFDIKLGLNYNINNISTIGIDYSYKIRASEILDSKLNRYNTSTFGIYYLYKF